jgi:hypothetical protein
MNRLKREVVENLIRLQNDVEWNTKLAKIKLPNDERALDKIVEKILNLRESLSWLLVVEEEE